MLLLPAAQHKLTSTAGTEPLGSLNKGKPSSKPSLTTRLDWQQYMGGTKSSKAEPGKKLEPDLLTWPYADLQTGTELPGRLALIRLSAGNGFLSYMVTKFPAWVLHTTLSAVGLRLSAEEATHVGGIRCIIACILLQWVRSGHA